MYAGAPYGSTSYAGTASTRKVWLVGKSQSQAVAKPVTWHTFWEIGKSQSQTVAKDIEWNFVWLIGKSVSRTEAKAVVFEPSGVADWNIGKSVSQSVVKPINWLTFWEIAKSVSRTQAKDVNWLTFWEIAKSISQTEAKDIIFEASGTVDWDIGKSVSVTIVKDVDLDYIPITAIPDLTVQRAANKLSAEIDLLNTANAKLAIIRADGYIAAFEDLDTVEVSSLPYTDSPLDADGNYNYRAYFVILGEKDGQPHTVAGEPGSIRTTIGKNQTL